MRAKPRATFACPLDESEGEVLHGVLRARSKRACGVERAEHFVSERTSSRVPSKADRIRQEEGVAVKTASPMTYATRRACGPGCGAPERSYGPR